MKSLRRGQTNIHHGRRATTTENKSGLATCPRLEHGRIDLSQANLTTVVGESGAWRSITDDMRRRGYNVSSPEDIDRLMLSLRQTREASIARKRSETHQAIQEKSQRIAALKSESGLLKYILNWFRLRDLQSQIAELDSAIDQHAPILDAEMHYVESVRNSPLLAGARAELTVIEHLRRLPAAYVVLNDVRLQATRHIRFNGESLQSAQIDHLVLSPAGVFIIETKHWSGRSAQSGQYHDPFAQVQRARYLCSYLLRESFDKITVRTIIASLGDLPPRPEDTYAKVLPPNELVGYISWFAQPELSPGRIDALRRYFESRVPV